MQQQANGLRARREAVGLSQERLARQVDCSTNTIRLVEHGYRPSGDMVRRIAAALGCKPHELLEIVDEGQA